MNDPYDEFLRPSGADQKWYVFRTRARHEKKSSERFEELGIQHYLPLRDKTVRRKKGRRTVSRLPLFPGYVFGCCDDPQRLAVMRSGMLAQWLDVKDQEKFLRELRNISAASKATTSLHLYPRLQRGMWVRVVSGPLTGVVGRISRRKDCYRVVLDMTALASAVAVEVDMQDVVEINCY